jgi:hypothetical protein
VGTLQPILAEIGRVIQDLALTCPDEREQAWRAAEERLRRQMDDEEMAALNLDQDANDAEPLAGQPSPVTLAELERLLTQIPAMAALFSPGSETGTRRLQIDRVTATVTFNVGIADEHPDSVRLLTYGDPVFGL